jgi:tetratricopeptide (TPR) repeat protein
MIATLAFAVFARQMQMDHSGMQMNPPATLRTGLGNVHHKVNTKNKKAQEFFDQGLALTYGFNHHAAIAAFEEAAKLDPNLAMAHWGKAYAMGMNINMPIDAATNKAANEEVQKAVSMEGKASPEEKALIDALAQRYSNDDNPDFDKLNNAYSHAMSDVARKYPDDLDASTLYAESIMDLHPWKLYTIDGHPIPGTETVISTLQGVLKEDKNHIGANHFLIHAVEAGPHPELGLESAHRLEKLAPQSGHLVHMPSHIYLRMGDWQRGIKSNDAALNVDRAFLEKTPDPGVYPMYYVHNFDMYRTCADMAGSYSEAIWGANNVAEKAATMGPMGEPYSIVPWLEMTRFGKWKDVLAVAAPTSQLPFVQAVYHYVRGMSFASTNALDDAQKEYDLFTDLRAKVPSDFAWGLGPASQVLEVQGDLLGARMMKARNNHQMEIDLLRKAVGAYDQIGYDEPADFYFPVRESLGFALLRANQHADAVACFEEEVKRHPNSGRALFGLARAYLLNGPMAGADAADEAFKIAWKKSDTQLSLDDL